MLLHRGLAARLGCLSRLLISSETIGFLQRMTQLVHGARKGTDLVATGGLAQNEVVVAPGKLVEHLRSAHQRVRNAADEFVSDTDGQEDGGREQSQHRP